MMARWNEARLRLRHCLEQGMAARIGDTAVVSRWVHVVDPTCPEEVVAVQGADAGRVFYQRRLTGGIIHVDLFHEVGELCHRQCAQRIRQALAQGNACIDPDLFDVQTGAGGGRITGELVYGQRLQLRRAHLNHVHIAGRLADEECGVLLDVVAAVEEEIEEQGLELRKVERVLVQKSEKGQPIDTSNYQSETDSLLKEQREEDKLLEESSSYQLALELAEDFGSIGELLDAMAELERPVPVGDLVVAPIRQRTSADLVENLVRHGLINKSGPRYQLTDRGVRLRAFLSDHRHELEMQLRRLIRRVPTFLRAHDRISHARPDRRNRPQSNRRMPASSDASGEHAVELALPDTAVAAARRRYGESGRGPLTFAVEDMRYYQVRGYKGMDICLLIDASASMAGRRIRAAKFLAQHLLLSTRERVAVVAFQENKCAVHVPFTRNYQKVQKGLGNLQPLGLTPLAEGLSGSLDYIKAARSRRPLLLLITDGIPTVPKWSLNPIEDALSVSMRLVEEKVRFSCIGLEPNRAFLDALATTARGSLYIVDELKREALVSIAHQERRQSSSTS